MKSRLVYAPLAALALAAVQPLSAQPFPGDAPEAARACAQCHGVTGNDSLDPSYPRIAGQHADYLEKALHDYRSGLRENALMAPFAQNLSNQDIRDVAAYFAAQDGALVDISHMDR